MKGSSTNGNSADVILSCSISIRLFNLFQEISATRGGCPPIAIEIAIKSSDLVLDTTIFSYLGLLRVQSLYKNIQS